MGQVGLDESVLLKTENIKLWKKACANLSNSVIICVFLKNFRFLNRDNFRSLQIRLIMKKVYMEFCLEMLKKLTQLPLIYWMFFGAI